MSANPAIDLMWVGQGGTVVRPFMMHRLLEQCAPCERTLQAVSSDSPNHTKLRPVTMYAGFVFSTTILATLGTSLRKCICTLHQSESGGAPLGHLRGPKRRSLIFNPDTEIHQFRPSQCSALFQFLARSGACSVAECLGDAAVTPADCDIPFSQTHASCCDLKPTSP